MIVDSPGVGESDVMSEFVLNYLPHAFCFMYVISSVNAGGIQDDRVSALIVGYLQNKLSRNMSNPVKRSGILGSEQKIQNEPKEKKVKLPIITDVKLG